MAITDVDYSRDVRTINWNDRQFIIIGTAHISKRSAELVKQVIEEEKPDSVCVELDEQRFKALSEKKKWESLDLKQVIKNKQLPTLIINLLLASYQKKLGEKLGVTPGIELLEATKVAKDNNINLVLCDRDVRITLKRAWRSMTFWQKIKFLTVGLASVFEKQEITEEKLEEIRDKDVLSEMMNELGNVMPVLKNVLIDERDLYLTQKMKSAQGDKIVAVVGAGHVEGITNTFKLETNTDLSIIEQIPKAPPTAKILGWGIPIVIIGSIFAIGLTKGSDAAGSNLLFWILANGIPSAIGALIAFGHPITIIAAFLAAPITSLSPLIGAGYVAAFIQTYFVPPVVKEFEKVGDDFSKFSRWWKNKLLRILLVFILSSLGSALGTYVGAYTIIKNLFS